MSIMSRRHLLAGGATLALSSAMLALGGCPAPVGTPPSSRGLLSKRHGAVLRHEVDSISWTVTDTYICGGIILLRDGDGRCTVLEMVRDAAGPDGQVWLRFGDDGAMHLEV